MAANKGRVREELRKKKLESDKRIKSLFTGVLLVFPSLALQGIFIFIATYSEALRRSTTWFILRHYLFLRTVRWFQLLFRSTTGHDRSWNELREMVRRLVVKVSGLQNPNGELCQIASRVPMDLCKTSIIVGMLKFSFKAFGV